MCICVFLIYIYTHICVCVCVCVCVYPSLKRTHLGGYMGISEKFLTCSLCRIPKVSMGYLQLSQNSRTFIGECPSKRHIIPSRAASLPSGIIQRMGCTFFFPPVAEKYFKALFEHALNFSFRKQRVRE